MNTNDEGNFPIKIDNMLISWLQKAILWSVNVLAVFMTGVIIWGVFDVGVIIYSKMLEPPYFILNIEDIFGTFGAFLAILIAIEIFMNIVLYLRKDVIHLKLVIATALMAISRKVIVLDYEHASPFLLIGVGAIIVSLGIAYWLVHKNTSQPTLKIEPPFQ